MPQKLIQVRISPNSPQELLQKIPELVEREGGQNLQAPRIFPPIMMIAGSEELCEKIRTTYPTAQVEIKDDLDD